MKQYTILAILLLFIHASCSDDGVEINDIADFEDFVRDEMERQHIPATAVLIFDGQTVLYEKYYGQSNIASNTPLMDDHLFLMASVSKVFTGAALLQLYEDGAFDLDDSINDYLPFSVQIPGYTEAITFRMLLAHTSGIADNDLVMDEHYFYGQDPPVSLAAFMEDYLSVDGIYYDANENFFDFQPGTQHEYSNIGSALIGVLVEEIAGTDFNTYCKQNIFNPLNMQNTAWRLDEITATIVTPYDYIDGQNQAIEHYTNTDYPNGGLRTTANDLHTFVATLANDGQSGNFQLLEPSTVQAMMTPQIPSIDNTVGLHFFIMDSSNNIWGHDGGEQGVATIMGFNPTSKIGAIVLTNQGEADLDELFLEAYKLGLTL